MEVNDRITSVKAHWVYQHLIGACVTQIKEGTYGSLVRLRCLDGEYRWLPTGEIDGYCSEPHWIAAGRPGVVA